MVIYASDAREIREDSEEMHISAFDKSFEKALREQDFPLKIQFLESTDSSPGTHLRNVPLSILRGICQEYKYAGWDVEVQRPDDGFTYVTVKEMIEQQEAAPTHRVNWT